MAQEFYGYFDSTPEDARDYNENDLSRGYRIMCDTGVSTLDEDNLKVFPADSGLRARVHYGGAMVHGFPYELYDDGGSPMLVDHTLAVAHPRIDRVVLRLDLGSDARHITLAVLEGEEAVEPTPPALTRGGTIHEIALAQCRVSPGQTIFQEADITDERGDPALCGNVRGADKEALQALTEARAAQASADAAGAVADAAQASADTAGTNAGTALATADAAREGLDQLQTEVYRDFNLKYVVAEALPAEATPRTIAILSDTSTTDIVMAENTPDAAEGRIWIRVEADGKNAMDVGGAANILVAEMSQYSAAGGWVGRDAYFEYLGAWKKFEPMLKNLFISGTQVVSWAQSTNSGNGTGTSTGTVGSTLYASAAYTSGTTGVGAGVATVNRVDVTYYSVLKINVSTIQLGQSVAQGVQPRIGLHASRVLRSGSGLANAVASNVITTTGEIAVSVASLVGSYYVGISCGSQLNTGTVIVSVNRVWLE